jgi:hypothetical protein
MDIYVMSDQVFSLQQERISQANSSTGRDNRNDTYLVAE